MTSSVVHGAPARESAHRRSSAAVDSNAKLPLAARGAATSSSPMTPRRSGRLAIAIARSAGPYRVAASTSRVLAMPSRKAAVPATAPGRLGLEGDRNRPSHAGRHPFVGDPEREGHAAERSIRRRHRPVSSVPAIRTLWATWAVVSSTGDQRGSTELDRAVGFGRDVPLRARVGAGGFEGEHPRADAQVLIPSTRATDRRSAGRRARTPRRASESRSRPPCRRRVRASVVRPPQTPVRSPPAVARVRCGIDRRRVRARPRHPGP